MAAAQYAFPAAVGCSVMAVGQGRFSSAAVNCAVHQVFPGHRSDQDLPAFARWILAGRPRA
jgi:hypothetical protein